ncbi:MAG TPA: GAF domain-containing protein [Thermomicrobiales bacterium]|nr:GAF domain-containing protein [Thermomicrobiales bacterium]
MVTIGEQLQLSRRLATTLQAQRAAALNAWLRRLREIPRDFHGDRPTAHLEELVPAAVDALIAHLARGDRKSLRRVGVSWAARQDGMGVGLGESVQAILALGPALAPLLRRAGLGAGQELVDAFAAALAEEVCRAYAAALHRQAEREHHVGRAAEERLLSLQAVAGAVAQERDPERTLDLIAREAVKLTGAERATVYLPSADDATLAPVVRIAPDGARPGGAPLPVEGTTLGHVYRSGYLLVANGADGEQDAAATQSTIVAPLRTRHGVIGVLGVERGGGEGFARADVELLGLLADQAAIALENARLFQEAGRRADELATLYRVGAVANRSLDLDRILHDALDYILGALDLTAGNIYLLDRRQTTLTLRAQRGFADDFATAGAAIPAGTGPVGRVAASGELLLIDDVDAQPDLTRGVLAARAVRVYAGIPLRGKERVLGVLNVFGAQPRQGEDRLRALALLTSIGDQVGVAIENATLLAQREQRLTRLAVLNEISRAISAVLDLDSLYDAIYAGCSRLFDTTNFYIALYDAEADAPVAQRRYHRGERDRTREGAALRTGLCRVVVETGQPLLTSDYYAECARRGVAVADPVDGTGPIAWLGAPVAAGARVLGAIVVAADGAHYTREDLTLLSAIANGCAVALENARAYGREQLRADQLRALTELTRGAVGVRDVDTLLPLIAGGVRAIFGYAHVVILLHEPEAAELVLRAHARDGDDSGDLGLRIPVGEHVVGHVAATREPLMVNDVAREPRFLRPPSLSDTRAELALPIVLGDQLLGVLSVESTCVAAFDDVDVATLQTVADSIAAAIENTRLFEEERRRRHEMASILDVTKASTSSLLLDEVLARVARGVVEAIGKPPSCGLYLLDETGRWLLPASGATGPLAQTTGAHFYDTPIDLTRDDFLREVVEQRHSLFCADAAADPRTNKDVVRALHLHSMLAVPLIAKERVLGVAVVATVRDRFDFTPRQVRLVEGIADTAALALENARLYAQSRELATAEERNRLAREIHDTLAQGLTAVTLHLEVADALLDTGQTAVAREKVHKAMELTRANLEEARRSVLDLRAAPLQDLSLPEALGQLVERVGREHGVETCYCTRGVDDRLPSRLEAGFYRIAQELLTNVGKHAKATQVDVRLERPNGSIVLTVADDGVGFDPATLGAPGVRGGFGLTGLRERVALLGGALHLDSAPDEGTRVRVIVPYAEVRNEK